MTMLSRDGPAGRRIVLAGDTERGTAMTRILPLLAAASVLSGCAYLTEGRDERLPSAAELGAGDCRQAGPQDPVAPGEWICDRGDSPFLRTQPRHRVEGN